ncbi:MAG: M28 family metallopeptidase [Aeromicrobium sp.]|uniref:M28 family metallopeptidase n=1 Tax=Aeromicrobium sp. TaxID=1871063 RepID=UPI003C675713
MRKTIASAAAAALTVTLFAATPATAGKDDNTKGQKPSSKTVDTRKLEKAVSVNGLMQHLREFQVIADRNDGNRASGLPGHTASADYVAKKLRKAGYQVTRQEFTFAFSREVEPATLTQTAPTERDFDTATFDYSGSGDVTGPVVNIDHVLPPSEKPNGSTSGCEASDFPPAPAEDAVALIQRGTCPFGLKASNAEEAGYDAVIIFNEGQPGRQDLIVGTLGAPADIPVVGLSHEDGAALAQTPAAEVHVTTKTENDLNRTTENVIADLPSKSKVRNPDQTVVVGAHLDSVTEGAGINDNGSGSAGILEIAEQLAALKYTKKLERPVRFAFWGAEEAGLLGSEHYVDNLSTAERGKIYANLNFDMIGSPNYGRFVYDGDGSDSDPAGPPGSGAIEDIFTGYFDSKKLASAPTEFSGRSDYGPFIAVGIPAGGLFTGAEGIKTAEEAVMFGGTAGVAYDVCYHSACDDIGNVNTKALQEMGDAAAHATLVMLQSKAGLFPDGSVAPKSKSAKVKKGAPGNPAHAAR